jgi:hypothetical protein
MDDEVGIEYVLKPFRHDRLSILAVGLHFASSVADAAAQTLGGLAMMTMQHQMQRDVDRKFERMISGS